ncbi:hypothetical protein [Qipengyuania soli]|uniref:Uncharacterized protein n=1 Tax=Qipengyuania soli TaxID=2782568 RepID=A0A7S8IWH7_9SPHN|nr:hypothetical protein [Qipengyuania soli]QPD00022.1 hypothetical protein IRL76_05680 [Qipengyuania soli]
MEYEILDEPQGAERQDLGTADGGLVEDHIALRNQSSVEPEDYPIPNRRNSSLVMSPE